MNQKKLSPRLVLRRQNCNDKNDGGVPDSETAPKSNEFFEECCTEDLSKSMREKYTDSVDFINLCHRVMNKLLRKKCTESGDAEEQGDFKIPEITNFLCILDLLLGKSSAVIHSRNSSPEARSYSNINSPPEDEKKPIPKTTETPKAASVRSSYTKSNSYAKSYLISKKMTSRTQYNDTPKKLLQSKDQQCNVNEATMNSNDNKVTSNPQSPRPSTVPKQSNTSHQTTCNNNATSKAKDPSNKQTSQRKNNRASEKCVTSENQECDKHLADIIQKQIKKFLDSSGEDSYAKKQQNLDIDNFRIVNISSSFNVLNYELCDSSDRMLQSVSRKTSEEYMEPSGELTKEVDRRKPCTNMCNLQADEGLGFRLDISIPERVQNLVNNFRIKENYAKPLPKAGHLNIIMNHDSMYNTHDNQNDDNEEGNSTICSDEEQDSNLKAKKVNFNVATTKSVTKVLNAFTLKRKPADYSIDKKSTHPLELNSRDLSSLNKKALSSIGLFTEKGQIRPQVLQFLRNEKQLQNINRTKLFRRSRDNSPNSSATNSPGFPSRCTSSHDSLSEIKSDSEG